MNESAVTSTSTSASTKNGRTLTQHEGEIIATISSLSSSSAQTSDIHVHVHTNEERKKCSPSIFPKIISGSIGSIVTALVVTPLEVVKVRQQTAAPPERTTIPRPSGGAVTRPCPSCGTIVFNNGLMECIVSRKSVPYMYMDRSNKAQSNSLAISGGRNTNAGTFGMLRSIYVKEGFAGIYAGLAPTLVMSVPNTVLYFTTYDELVSWLRRQDSLRSSNNSWMPLVAGSSARLLASLVTAPLELIRTRQAIAGASSGSSSVWGDLRRLVKHEGGAALFQGLGPTLWRDVPFSAIYWFSLEQFKLQWQQRYPNEHYKPAPLEQAGQAFINGAAAGMIAAACTTPFDVVKTRHQALGFSRSKTLSAAPVAQHQSAPAAKGAVCHHNGATAVQQQKVVAKAQNTILGTVKQVVAEEGVAGLWRGNATRIYKVAPACAIMISCYELGKILLE